ncbi:Microfibril-associated glycoprotein 4, partial [Ophiophagus hannah]
MSLIGSSVGGRCIAKGLQRRPKEAASKENRKSYTESNRSDSSGITEQHEAQQSQPCGEDSFPLDCEDIYDQGAETDGVYLIFPAGPSVPVPVYCDMTTDDGKWTTSPFARNFWNVKCLGFFPKQMKPGPENYIMKCNCSVYYESRPASSAKNSLAFLPGQHFWGSSPKGLQNIHLLTLKQKYELRVELEDFENNTAFAKYADFSLSPNAISAEEDGYTLYVSGFTDGGAGDSLSYHSGQKFSTFDRDQDLYVQNCAALSSGAWWFKSCHFSNLNGFYLGGPHLSYANGINWFQWKGFYYSLKRSEMKIRRV